MPAVIDAAERAMLREWSFLSDIISLKLEDMAGGYGQGRLDDLQERYLLARDAARNLEQALEYVTHGDEADPGLPGPGVGLVYEVAVPATAELSG